MSDFMKRIEDFSWWECDAVSLLLLWKSTKLYQSWYREGQPHYAIINYPQFLRSQDPAKTEEYRTNMKKKVDKVRKGMYVDPETMPSLSHMFYVRKGLKNIQMVYNDI